MARATDIFWALLIYEFAILHVDLMGVPRNLFKIVDLAVLRDKQMLPVYKIPRVIKVRGKTKIPNVSLLYIFCILLQMLK